MFHPRRLAPLKNHNHCWRRAPVSVLVLFPSKQPGRQAAPRKPACRLDVWVVPWHSRDEKKAPAQMTKSPPRAELLAPAGDEESLRAAVAAGADAVYFGLRGGFNARARADNFAVADLPRIFD